MKMWTQYFFSELDMAFLVRAFVITLVGVASYAIITMAVVRLYFRNKSDKSGLEILRRVLVRLPFLTTGYGFLGGLIGYFGVLVIDSSLQDRHPMTGRPEIALVVFTLFGFFAGAYTGFTVLYKTLSAGKKSK